MKKLSSLKIFETYKHYCICYELFSNSLKLNYQMHKINLLKRKGYDQLSSFNDQV